MTPIIFLSIAVYILGVVLFTLSAAKHWEDKPKDFEERYTTIVLACWFWPLTLVFMIYGLPYIVCKIFQEHRKK